MSDKEPFDVLLLVTELLDELGVLYVLGGSLASTAYGQTRTTVDADVVADLRSDQVRPFVQALQAQFYVDEGAAADAIQRKGSFNLLHLDTMFKVDIFIPKDRLFDQQQLARRRARTIYDNPVQKIWFVSPEDIILAKLEWFRLGGEVSERQWRDVLGVIRSQSDQLDHAYLRQWATILNVADLLEVALQDKS